MPRILILDSEPVQALLDSQHPKHGVAMAHLEVSALRNRRRAGSLHVVVPATVRVEAGWDRTACRSAATNRLPIADHALATTTADRAARLRSDLGVSPADAHIGAVLQSAQDDVSVVTSDLDDLLRIVQRTGKAATIVRI